MPSSKNPQRQLGQYRHLVKVHSKLVRLSWLFWIAPVILLVASFYFAWPVLVKVVCIVGVITGVIGQSNQNSTLRLYQEKVQEFEDQELGN